MVYFENAEYLFLFRVDSDLVSRRHIKQNEDKNSVMATEGKNNENYNPLYESTNQIDDQNNYSSNENTLYVSSDC